MAGLIYIGKCTSQSRSVYLIVGRETKKLYATVPFLLFFVFKGNSKYKLPAAYIRRGDLMGGFSVTNLGGLYLEGLVRGGGYLRNFTYIHLCWKFSGYDSCTFLCHLSGCEKGLKSFH